MKNNDITIIGFGVTGMLVLAILNQHKFDCSKIAIVDPYFDGGNLIRQYGDVLSNTPLLKTINALKLINPNYELPDEYKHYDVNVITPLHVCVELIQDIIKPIVNKCDLYQTKVKSLSYDNVHILNTEDLNILHSKTIVLCQGASSKVLKTNIPTIPLEISLNKDLLKKYVKQTSKVMVFGTSHSGCLVLENLQNLGIETTAIYKKENPFLFAKDGIYDGIKEEAEKIATKIVNNEYKHISLKNIKDIESLIKISKEATHVIYAIGFETKPTIQSNNSIVNYDSVTGKLLELPNAWGFGIAYPSLAPDTIHYDVGIISFVEHIQKHIMELKNSIN
jgi:pyruvate/2-oxoglutarate dehydrogenase complex dihydrolipoamide dehydrogenase (E3) component